MDPVPNPTAEAAARKIAVLEKQRATQQTMIEGAQSAIAILDVQLTALRQLVPPAAK